VISVVVVLVLSAVLWQRWGGPSLPGPAEAARPPARASALSQRQAFTAAPERARQEPGAEPSAAPAARLCLQGRVLDRSGEPAEGASVSVDTLPAQGQRVGRDGQFRFEGLTEGTYRVRAWASDGSAAARQVFLDAETPDLELTLESAAALAVLVVERSERLPLAGVLVSVEGAPGLAGTTGADGKLTLAGVPRGRHVITASRDGFAPARTALFEDRGSGTRQLTFQLEPGIAVFGQVVNSAGAAIAGALVRALVPSALSVESAFAGEPVRTDASGQYRIRALPPGTFRLTAEHPEWSPGSSEELRLERGSRERGPIQIVVQEGARLNGQVVLASGSPAAGALVGVRSAGTAALVGLRRSTQTDEQGLFSFRGLPPAEVWVDARAEGAVAEPVSVDLRRGSESVSLLLESAGVIRGVVLSSAGEPLPGAQVAAIPEDGERRAGLADSRVGQYAADVSDELGQFQLSGLLPGKYRLRTSTTHAVETPDFWMGPSVLAETGDLAVRLVVSSMARLHARVELADGKEPDVLFATLSLAPPVTLQHTQGRLVLEDVPPGNHVVSVSAPGYLARELDAADVRAGEDRDLGQIVLELGHSLSGMVVDAAGEPAPGVRVSAGAQLTGDGTAPRQPGALALTDESGRFELTGLSPGPLRILADDAERGRSEPIEIDVGEPSPPLRLMLQRSTSLAGVVTRDGKPVQGAAVVAAPRGSSTVRLAVATQADGRFQFERLGTGPHVLTAGLRLSPTLQFADRRSVMIGAEPAPIAIDTSTRGPEVILLLPEGNAPELAQLHLVTGDIRASTLDQLEALVAAQSPGQSWVALSIEGRPAVLPRVQPGRYSACSVIIRGKLDDPAVQYRVRAHAGASRVHCQPVEVTAEPARQEVALTAGQDEPRPRNG
jgi:protocatechuate 3,4-dioxygenase beta subunit